MQTSPPEQLHDAGHHERPDPGHHGARQQRHHRQGPGPALSADAARSVFAVNHDLSRSPAGAPPGAPGCRAGEGVGVFGGAARAAPPGEPPAGAPGQRLGGAAEGAGAVRRRADAAGEPSAEGRHGQDGEGEGPGGGEPAGQVGSGHSDSSLEDFRAFSSDFTEKLVVANSSSKQAKVSVLSCERNVG